MIHSLKDLLILQLQDLYDAENRNATLLTKLHQLASDSRLKQALADHSVETDAQIVRLRDACDHYQVSPQGETCEATKGLVREAEELVGKTANPAITDAAIIVSVQRIEHYEIASYGSAAFSAECLGQKAVADLIKATLSEEKSADERLTKIAKGGVFSEGVTEVASHN